tara:strand:- start:217 stop:423 length:207 start_codon:yes stop_codon:yes gene_type:complete
MSENDFEDVMRAVVRVDYEPSDRKRISELLDILFISYTLSIKERTEISEILVDYIRYDVPQQVRDACE